MKHHLTEIAAEHLRSLIDGHGNVTKNGKHMH